MSEHVATVRWRRGGDSFADNRYSRVHEWVFDGGVTVRASASPQVVREPMSSAEAVDPEEAFVAALSSCHMLWFLSLAAKEGFVVDSYEDNAVGFLKRVERGVLMVTDVVLRPAIRFSGERQPSREDIERLHHQSHASCFIANSVKTNVRVESP